MLQNNRNMGVYEQCHALSCECSKSHPSPNCTYCIRLALSCTHSRMKATLEINMRHEDVENVRENGYLQSHFIHSRAWTAVICMPAWAQNDAKLALPSLALNVWNHTEISCKAQTRVTFKSILNYFVLPHHRAFHRTSSPPTRPLSSVIRQHEILQ